jgi:hypothetical protein
MIIPSRAVLREEWVELGTVGMIRLMGVVRVAFMMACVGYEGLDGWDGVYTGQTDFEMVRDEH